MRQLVDQSYQFFVQSNSSAMALATTILALAVLIRVLPILLGTEDAHRAMAGLRLFFVRIVVIFTVFLGSTVVSSSGSMISDWFVDGPLAAGTELGTKLAQVVSTVLPVQGGNPMGSDLSSGDSGGSNATFGTDPGISLGLVDTDQGDGGGSTGAAGSTTTPSSTAVDLGTQHVTAAKAILYQLHELGVAGIVTGLWLAMTAPGQIGANPVTMVTLIIVGLMMATQFFMFTVTFGLRYVDALIRSMLIFSLMPIFAFLWIFDSTREIAMKAVKTGLSLAAVFMVSGVVYTIAILIMEVGFQKAFNNSSNGATGSISTASLQSVLSQINGGAFSFLNGNSGTSSSLNWLSLFYLMGCGMVAISCAKLAFEIASALFNFERAELGIGREVEGEVVGAAQQMRGAGTAMIGGR
ncbi:MAG: hypothetical protein EPN75_08745 [Beijerinckiaceae bacterium]|nr:MAG: hypothetical protein EPN75_08745 [Beijerinckiaceae bacterium]